MRWMELLREGGDWLGAARNWIKWNVPGGDRVKWNSQEPLTKTFRVRDVEEIAAQSAAAMERQCGARTEDLEKALRLMSKAARRLVARGVIRASDFIDETNTARWEDVFLAEYILLRSEVPGLPPTSDTIEEST